MSKRVHEDIVEQILIELDVKDLLRFKNVCKSWRVLITSPRFINLHLNRSYYKDRNDNGIGHRRVSLVDGDHRSPHIVGSSNGLVCTAYSFGLELSVANPLTGEVTRLSPSPFMGISLCWGFGYDSSTDDYKVIVKGKDKTCVKVMSMKSDVWRVIEEVKYTFISKTGVLSNGALHWIVEDQTDKKLIIAFELSTEKFNEIILPDDTGFECTSSSYLGVFNECLCIFRRLDCCLLDDLWMMKSYNVKESWERLPHNHNMKHDIVLYLKGYVSWVSKTLEYHWGCDRGWDHTAAPIFVRTLVSPYVNGRPKWDRNIMRRAGVGSLAAPPSPVYPHFNERLNHNKVGSIAAPPRPVYPHFIERLNHYKAGSIDAPQSAVDPHYEERPKRKNIIRGPFSCKLALLKKQSK